MSKVIKLKKGLDIKLNGEAEKVVQPAGRITSCALKPTDFRAMTPKLAVKVGDEVKAGDVLFIDKTHPEIKFTTPVSGTIEAINRGERRKLLEVVVKADAEIRYRDFGKTEVPIALLPARWKTACCRETGYGSISGRFGGETETRNTEMSWYSNYPKSLKPNRV